MTHQLKCWPKPFWEVFHGRKRFEIRKDDRSFAVGDTLDLREWNPDALNRSTMQATLGVYTGQAIVCSVTYISRGPDWGLPEGLVVMSIERVLP